MGFFLLLGFWVLIHVAVKEVMEYFQHTTAIKVQALTAEEENVLTTSSFHQPPKVHPVTFLILTFRFFPLICQTFTNFGGKLARPKISTFLLLFTVPLCFGAVIFAWNWASKHKKSVRPILPVFPYVYRFTGPRWDELIIHGMPNKREKRAGSSEKAYYFPILHAITDREIWGKICFYPPRRERGERAERKYAAWLVKTQVLLSSVPCRFFSILNFPFLIIRACKLAQMARLWCLWRDRFPRTLFLPSLSLREA